MEGGVVMKESKIFGWAMLTGPSLALIIGLGPQVMVRLVLVLGLALVAAAWIYIAVGLIYLDT